LTAPSLMNAQTGTYDGKDLAQGTKLFRQRLEEMISENPELSNIHQAFEQYCANKYSLGNSASNQRVGGSNETFTRNTTTPTTLGSVKSRRMIG
jgi:hypothetical protein